MSDQHPASYYVPNEIIYCFVDRRLPNERSESLFKTGQEVINRLPNQDEFQNGVNGLTLKPFQMVLPNPDQSGQPIVLVKLEIKRAEDLPAFIARAFQNSDGAGDGPKWVMPNWYGGVSGHIGTGGPGGKPMPLPSAAATAQTTEFFLAELQSTSLSQYDASGEIDVYVLDTLPDKTISKGMNQTIKMGEEINDKSGYADHPLGKIIEGGFETDSTDTSNSWKSPGGELRFTWADDLCPGVFGSLFNPDGSAKNFVKDHDPAEDEPYEVSDHGIFIAGIIKQIAPRAKIHIIQVLDNYGVGTVQSVANGFAYLAQLRSTALAHHLREKDPKATLPPYLVNCSFTFTTPVPILDDVFRRWHPLPEGDPLFAFVNGNETYQAKTQAFFEALVPSKQSLQTLANLAASQQDCLVIAAAGNDSDLPHNNRLAARYPANVGTVLGVGALARDFHVWEYSNVSDTPASAGILTLGVVQNVFTQKFPGTKNNPASKDNPAGFAEWAGTSFATAVMTGYVAKVCLDGGLLPLGALAFLDSIVQTNPLTSEAMLMVSQRNAVAMP